MTKPRMFQVEQMDLLGAGQVVAVVERRAVEAVPAKRRKRMAETSLEAGRERLKSRKLTADDRRVHDEVKRQGQLGRTRNEIAEALGMEIQTVCWCVDRLLKAGLVFEPVVGHKENGAPLHRTRSRSKVLLDQLYARAA